MRKNATVIAISTILPLIVGCGKFRRGGSDDAKLQYDLAKCQTNFQSKKYTPALAFQSCEQIQGQWLLAYEYDSCVSEAYQTHRERTESERGIHAASSADVVAKSADSARAKDVLTNVRHAGIDEADMVKISQEQFFVIGSDGINVVDRKTKKLIGTLAVGEAIQSHSRWDRPESNTQLLVAQDKLIVLSGSKVAVYDVLPNALPRLRQKREFKGRILEARLRNDSITLVMQGHLKTKQVSQKNGVLTTNLVLDNEDCSSIYASSDNNYLSTNLTRIETFPVSNIFELKSISFLGENKMYMTDKNIYLYPQYSHFRWRGSAQGSATQLETSSLRRIPLNADGSLGNPAIGEVKGRIKDVWALSELATGELAVATTTGQLWNNSARNHFTVLAEQEGQLRKIGETPEYGANEDIRSVRFVGNTAYVVTFKNTDPLFAIDLTEPASPKILGELKIPGFSTYMHPLNENQLIGLGFDAIEYERRAAIQGLQLSLFDVSNPKEMARTDVKVFGTSGSHSAAINDHRAFFLDAEQGIMAFPVELIHSCSNIDLTCMNQKNLISALLKQSGMISGAAVVNIEQNKFGTEKFISHADLVSENCKDSGIQTRWNTSAHSRDIERILKVDGEYVSFSKLGMKVFRINDQVETIHSTRWYSTCAH